MGVESEGDRSARPLPASGTDAATGFWARVQQHKIIQWGVAYLGVALALAHGEDLVGHAFEWPGVLGRVFMIGLIAGFPIALTLAWYHGHRGLKRISTGELTIISLLLLIGAVFFTVSLRLAEHATDATAHEQTGVLTPVETPRAATSGTANPGSGGEVLPNSVAVLPLENLSPDPANAYIADGLHEEILNQLVKLHNLTVISRTSVLQYRENRPPVAEIAKALRAQAIMEGSIRYAGDRIRVTTQLIDPRTGTHLWSETYERKFDDVFAIESDIAMNVANALTIEFSGEEQKAVERAPTASPEAYALLLQSQGIATTALNDPRITDLLRQAIEIDPDFALAHARLAWLSGQTLTNTVMGAAVDPQKRAELEAFVREHAERAIELDPTVPFAHAALADRALFSWHWTDAALAYERALEAAPNDGSARAYFGLLLSFLGRHEESIRLLERGIELDPNNRLLTPAFSLSYAGRYDEAAASWRQAIEQNQAFNLGNPLGHQWVGYTEIARGNGVAALRELELSERLMGSNRTIVTLPELAHAYGRLGRKDDAERLFNEVKAAAAAGAPVGAGTWATVYLAIGDEAKALEWLAVVADEARRHEPDPGFFNAMDLKMNITNSPVLKQPKFVAVLDRVHGD